MSSTIATEYFVTYLDCPTSPPYCSSFLEGWRCLRPDYCDWWCPQYRCHIGNLTEKELEYFKQKSGFGNDPGYLLESVNDLALDSLEKREEHIQLRNNFECLLRWACEERELLRIIRRMNRLESAAKQTRKLRYGETPAPHFVDSKIACAFYKMEMEIITKATRLKIGLIRDYMAEPNASVGGLEIEETQLKNDFKTKLRELRELQEMVLALTAPPDIVDRNLTAPAHVDITGTESENDAKKQMKMPKDKTLKPPKPKINLETVIAGIYETRPETKTWDSARLLAYLKDWAREHGVTINVTHSRIRQLKIWESNRIHRESGKIRYGYNSEDIATVDDPDFDD